MIWISILLGCSVVVNLVLGIIVGSDAVRSQYALAEKKLDLEAKYLEHGNKFLEGSARAD